MHPVLILIAAKALGIGAYSAWKKARAKRLLRAGRRERAPRDVTAEAEVTGAGTDTGKGAGQVPDMAPADLSRNSGPRRVSI